MTRAATSAAAAGLDRRQLCKFLSSSRHAMHLSQTALAMQWGVSRSKIARWETPYGSTPIPPMVWHALVGMLLDRGKIVDVLASFIPHYDHEIPKFRPIVFTRSHWSGGRRS